MFDLSGTGSPEGVITASVGTRYTDTTTGTLWVKTSPAGTSGWMRLPAGDTGWRRLPGGTHVRRIGSNVYVQFYGNLPAETGTVEPDTLPPGFRPRWHSGTAYFLGSNLHRCHVLTSGVVRFYDVSTSGAFVTMSDHYATDQPWPATLPGTPA